MEIGSMFAELFLQFIFGQGTSRKALEFLCGERDDPGHFLENYFKGLVRDGDIPAVKDFSTRVLGLPRYQLQRLSHHSYPVFAASATSVGGEFTKDPMWPIAAELAWKNNYETAENSLKRLGYDARNKNDKLVRRDAGALVDEDTGASKHDALNHFTRELRPYDESEPPEDRDNEIDSRPNNLVSKETRPNLAGNPDDQAPRPYRVMRGGGEPEILQPGSEPPPPSGPPIKVALSSRDWWFERNNRILADAPVYANEDAHVNTATKFYPQSCGRPRMRADFLEIAVEWLRRQMRPDSIRFFELNTIEWLPLDQIVEQTGWTQKRAKAAQEAVRCAIYRIEALFRDKPLRFPETVRNGVRRQFLAPAPLLDRCRLDCKPGSGLGWVFKHDPSAHYPPAPPQVRTYAAPVLVVLGKRAEFPHSNPPLSWRALYACALPANTIPRKHRSIHKAFPEYRRLDPLETPPWRTPEVPRCPDAAPRGASWSDVEAKSSAIRRWLDDIDGRVALAYSEMNLPTRSGVRLARHTEWTEVPAARSAVSIGWGPVSFDSWWLDDPAFLE
jgi:hypothetical protein